MAMTQRLGFIGLGNMGGPMAQRLSAAGYSVIAFDKNPQALDACSGPERSNSALECAQAADILLTSLPRPDHVSGLMLEEGLANVLNSEQIWVDLTTNRRAFLQDVDRNFPFGVVDAPVTGAVDGARTGRLTLFAGGETNALDTVEPILSQLGRVIRCGQLGTGTVTKLVTNQLWFVHAAALGEAFAFGMANDVDLATLWDAIKDSVADSFVARHDAPSIFAGHYDPSFTLDLCLKDLGLLAEMQGRVGTDLPMTDAAHQVFQLAGERYGRQAGEMHVARRLEEDAGLSFRMDGEWVPHWEA